METFQTVDQLETKAECDEILEFVEDEIVDANFDKLSAEHEGRNVGNSSQTLEAELNSAKAEYANVTNAIAGLAEGPYKEKQITEQLRLQLKVRTLSKQAKTRGPRSLVKNELETKGYAYKLSILNDLKTQVQTKKDSLPA